MFRLTREIRFSLSPLTDEAIPNSHAGHPQLTTPVPWLKAQLTFATPTLDPRSSYVLDIKLIDQVFRAQALPLLRSRHGENTLAYDEALLQTLRATLAPHYPAATLERFTLALSPYHALTHAPNVQHPIPNAQLPMTTLHLRFEFSAAHRLHNPALSDEENRALFGKCNNPHAHGHNYELQVSLRDPHPPLPALEELVNEKVIRPYDHKHLNVEVDDFRSANPTVENIARAAYLRLKPHLPTLASTTVWETPKTWAEYSE